MRDKNLDLFSDIYETTMSIVHNINNKYRAVLEMGKNLIASQEKAEIGHWLHASVEVGYQFDGNFAA